jgi:YVTN family beta-propeller protein
MAGLTSVRGSSLPIIARIPIPGVPHWVGIGPDAVWISNGGKDNISRIDPKTNLVIATVAVGRNPCSGLGIISYSRRGRPANMQARTAVISQE